MITTVKRTASRALRAIILSSAIAQDHSVLPLDNRFKDAFFNNMPELVAFTSPAMGSKLCKFKESVPQHASI